MRLLFPRSGALARGELEELKKVLGRLRASDSQTRLAVGAGVHQANAEFIRQFGGIESFRRSSSEDQKRFCSELSDLELGSRGQEPGMALGVGLYRIWLAEMLADRREVSEMLGEELTRLSRKAAGA